MVIYLRKKEDVSYKTKFRMGKTFLMLGRDNFVQKEKVSQKMELFSMSERRIFPFWKESLSQDFPRAIYYPSLEWLPGWTGTPGNSAECKKKKLCGVVAWLDWDTRKLSRM
jgi:hypothetical protein